MKLYNNVYAPPYVMGLHCVVSRRGPCLAPSLEGDGNVCHGTAVKTVCNPVEQRERELLEAKITFGGC
jgi:hypothetical protein